MSRSSRNHQEITTRGCSSTLSSVPQCSLLTCSRQFLHQSRYFCVSNSLLLSPACCRGRGELQHLPLLPTVGSSTLLPPASEQMLKCP